MGAAEIVRLQEVKKDYILGNTVVQALRGIDLTVGAGEFLAIAGPSGSGKSTLLNIIGCMDVASAGSVQVDGEDIGRLPERRLTMLRRRKLGFVFQSFNLIAALNVFQNVEVPLLLQGGWTRRARREQVDRFLGLVGLVDYATRKPAELSGGQRQRVAVARALVAEPRLVLADEPTGNLDSDTGRQIVDLMWRLNNSEGTTFVFSTHDPLVTMRADRVVRLRDGRVEPAAPGSRVANEGV